MDIDASFDEIMGTLASTSTSSLDGIIAESNDNPSKPPSTIDGISAESNDNPSKPPSTQHIEMATTTSSIGLESLGSRVTDTPTVPSEHMKADVSFDVKYLDSFAVSLSLERSLSPVHSTFDSIDWGSVKCLKLTFLEIATLRRRSPKPIELMLFDLRDSSMFTRVIFKILANIAPRKRYCSHVAKLFSKDPLSETDALKVFDDDPLGVILHFCASQLRDIVFVLTTSTKKDLVPISKLFYVGKSRVLTDQIGSLLDIIENGANGDLFVTRELSLFVSQILLVGLNAESYSILFLNLDNDLHGVVEFTVRLVNWICALIEQCDHTSYHLAIPCLTELISNHSFRYLFVANDGIFALNKYLSFVWDEFKATKRTGGSEDKFGVASSQKLYEMLFLVWSLSFAVMRSSSCRESFHRSGIIAVLYDLLSFSPREKLVRLSLSSLRNCLTVISRDLSFSNCDSYSFGKELIALGLMRELKRLKAKGYSDPDVVDDIEFLEKTLQDICNEMSSWDYYENEVESGRLTWGFLHTTKFFKQNIKRFEGKHSDFRLVKRLSILLSSTIDETCAVACFDLGEFVRNYPNGKNILLRFGVRNLLVDLIDHKNADVQRESLRCLSRLLLKDDSVMMINGNEQK